MGEEQQDRPGATHRFPMGQINPNDLGELAVAIAVDRKHDRILMDFGPLPIKWIAMTAGQARGFAKVLREKARQLDGLEM